MSLRKHVQIFFIMFITLFSVNSAFADCESTSVFSLVTNELIIPCVDIGDSKCYRATLKLDAHEARVNQSYEFDLTFLGVDTSISPEFIDDRSLAKFNPDDLTVLIPEVIIDHTNGALRVILKLSPKQKTIGIPRFELLSAEVTTRTSSCKEEVITKACMIDDELFGHLTCAEFNGSPLFVNTYFDDCIGTIVRRCPDASIYKCSVGETNKSLTFYAYHTSFVDITEKACRN